MMLDWSFSEKELVRLQHAEEPLTYLMELGVSEDELAGVLWSLCEGESPKLRPNHTLMRALTDTVASMEPQRVIELSARCLEEEGEEWDISRSQREGYVLRWLGSLSQVAPEALFLKIDGLPAPYRGFVALEQVASGVRAKLPEAYLEEVAEWVFVRVEDRRVSAWMERLEERWGEVVELESWFEACRGLLFRRRLRGSGVRGFVGGSNERFPWREVLPLLTDEELIEVGRLQSFAELALTEESVRRGARLLEPLESAIFPISVREEEGREWSLSCGGLFLGWLHLAVEAGRAIPKSAELWYRWRLYRYVTDEEADEVAWALSVFPTKRAVRLLRRWLSWGSVRCLLGVVEDDDFLREVLVELPALVGGYMFSLKEYRKGFLRGGLRVVRLMAEVLTEEHPPMVVQFCASVLAESRLPESAEVLLGLLSHRLGSVRKEAIQGLLWHPEEWVLSGLKPHFFGSKKPTREAALEVLEGFADTPLRREVIREVLKEKCQAHVRTRLEVLVAQQEEDSPLLRLQALEAEAKRQLADGISAQLKALKGEEESAWRQLFEEVGLSIFFCINLYMDGLGRGEWATRLFWEAADHFRDDPLTPWCLVAAVEKHSDLAFEAESEKVRELLMSFDERLIEPLCELELVGGNRLLLLEVAREVGVMPSRKVFVRALEDRSKIVRNFALEALLEVGREALESVLPLLGHRKKEPRLMAATFLERLGAEAALEPLRAALKKERSQPVREALAAAIGACTPLDEVTLEGASVEEIERELCAVYRIRLPDFLALSSLPPLRHHAGKELSQVAVLGWLSLLSREHPERPCAQARVVMGGLMPSDVWAFGEALLGAWQEVGGPSHARWMKWQMAVSASPAWLYERAALYQLRDFRLFVHHPSQLSALLLTAYQAEAQTRRAQQLLSEYVALLPAERRPTQAQIDAMRLELKDVDCGDFSFEGGEWCRPPVEQKSFWRVGYVGAFPAPGEVPTALVFLEEREGSSYEFRPDSRAHITRERARRWELAQAQLNAEVARISSCLRDAREVGRAWTTQGWRRLFLENPLWRLLGQTQVFEIEGAGRFVYEPDTRKLVDSLGDPMTLPEDGRIRAVRWEVLSLEERERWERVMAAWTTTWQDVQPMDNISDETLDDSFRELRALMYESGTSKRWEELVSLLDHWPEGSVEIAAAYVESHAAERWSEVERIAPEHWLASLLTDANPLCQRLAEEGVQVQHGYQPRLWACEQLFLREVWLRKPDVVCWGFSDALRSIRSLRFSGGRIYKGADDALAELDCFPSLERLSIESTRVRWRGWGALVRAPWMSQIKALRLRHIGVDWRLLELLAEAGVFEGLEELDLCGNPLSLPGMQVLLECEALSGLKALHLAHMDIGEEGMLALAASSRFEGLETLHLVPPPGWETPPLEGVQALAESPHFPNLKQLSTAHLEVAGIHYIQPRRLLWQAVLLGSKTLPKEAIKALRRELLW